MFGLVYNSWFHNRCCVGAGMVVRFFIFSSNRGRKLGAGNWKKVRELPEKGKGSYYSWDTNIGYLTRRFQSDVAKRRARDLGDVHKFTNIFTLI